MTPTASHPPTPSELVDGTLSPSLAPVSDYADAADAKPSAKELMLEASLAMLCLESRPAAPLPPFAPKWDEGKGSKIRVLDIAETLGPNAMVIAQDYVKGERSQRFMALRSPPRLDRVDHHFYEAYPRDPNRLFHLFADLDWFKKDFEIACAAKGVPVLTPAEVLDVFYDGVETIHGTGTLRRETSTASGTLPNGDWKESWHVVFPTTLVKQSNLKAFGDRLRSFMETRGIPTRTPDDFFIVVDPSVYCPGRVLRMLWQSKMKAKMRVLEPYGDSSRDARDHLIVEYVNVSAAPTWSAPFAEVPAPGVGVVGGVGGVGNRGWSVDSPKFRSIVERAVALLDVTKRAGRGTYVQWIDLGLALRNAGVDIEDDDAFLNMWVDFSKKGGSAFKPGACEKEWRAFGSRVKRLTSRSIFSWAKADDPKGYEDVAREFFVLKQGMEAEAIAEYEEDVDSEAEGNPSSHVATAEDIAAAFEWGAKAAVGTIVLYDASIIPPTEEGLWAWLPNGEEPYSQVKKMFELYNFKINQFGNFGRLNRDSSVPTFNSEAQMRTIYKDWHFKKEKKGEDTSFIGRWFIDIDKRRYETVDFAPPPCTLPSYTLNTFYGYKAGELTCEPSTDMGVIEELIDIMGGRDAASKKYLIDWMASCLQKPSKKDAATAIVLHGEQGIGKNMLIEFFGKDIIGSAYYKKPQNAADTVFGRFADAVENTVLLFLDECKGLHKFNEKLKDLISSEEVTIERKGQMPIKMRNAAHLIMASNNESVVKVEATDRRYVLIHSSSEKMGNFAYFNSVRHWMDQPSNQRGFYDFLMARDISAVHLVEGRPKTAMYVDAKIDSLPLLTKWLITKVKDAAYPNTDGLIVPVLTVNSSYEREAFRNWAKLNGARDATFSDRYISLELVKLGVVNDPDIRVDHARSYRYIWATIRATIMRVTRLGEALFTD